MIFIINIRFPSAEDDHLEIGMRQRFKIVRADATTYAYKNGRSPYEQILQKYASSYESPYIVQRELIEAEEEISEESLDESEEESASVIDRNHDDGQQLKTNEAAADSNIDHDHDEV